jgi:hypothetical protein
MPVPGAVPRTVDKNKSIHAFLFLSKVRIGVKTKNLILAELRIEGARDAIAR